ncbi:MULTISPECIES: PadR family transcriptional regulator [Paenibacillus]|uniref:PadR family transcriptional regulator n=1 Tax=Paenibacillus TaxID=44249 RepID=UPI002041DED8|nr:PadR family transcriptional regulator [Paenibacillus camelliae]MCM3633325.1 PadR family transcriptional regulator [Paenibacillus camelliae]
MKNYNDTTYAILGILTTSCRSGYAIKQLIDQSLTHFWKISYGQIYPTLKLITEEGLATIQSSSQPGKPDRNEYELTDKGKEVLREWLEQPIKQISVERNEVLLKLFFGSHQSKQHTIRTLQDYKNKLEDRYATYVGIEQSITAHATDEEQDVQYWLLTLDYGKRTTIAAIEWCEHALLQFNQMEGG